MCEIICPICNTTIKREYDTMEAWGAPIVCEEYFYCNKCEYSYEFSYGVYRETIGKVELIWNYKETESERESRERKRDAALAVANRLDSKFFRWYKGLGAMLKLSQTQMAALSAASFALTVLIFVYLFVKLFM